MHLNLTRAGLKISKNFPCIFGTSIIPAFIRSPDFP